MGMTFRAPLIGAIFAVLTFTAATQSALARAATEMRAYHIEAQPLPEALNDWADQSDLQVMWSAQLSNSERQAPKVEGQFTAEVALKRVLHDSGFTYAFVDSQTVSIRAASETVSDASAMRPVNSVALAAAVAIEGERVVQSAGPQEEDGRKGLKQVDQDKTITEVVVTGTHIRGVQNKTVPVVSIDRRTIDKSGYGSTQQIVASLPQNFSGGSNGSGEAAIFGTGTGRLNFGNATGVNLRGLGTTATLVLLDGHRITPTIQGTAVDVSLIPISAIDHIDVLTDGASAVYGADAIAGVVNFVLRKDFDGAETSVRAGAVTSGSSQEFTVSQLGGINWAKGNAVLSAQYRDRDALSTSQRDFSVAAPRPNDLLPSTKDASLMVSLNQELGEDIDGFALGTYTHKTTSRDITVTRAPASSSRVASETDNFNVIAGAGYQATNDWRMELSGSYSTEDDNQENFYSSGIPAGYVNGAPFDRAEGYVWSVDAKINGTLFSLPAGSARIALGGSHRGENSHHRAYTGLFQTFSRKVNAGYAEVYVPLVSERNEVHFVKNLELSAAGRYDDYSDFGGTKNPRFGVFWAPVTDLGFRAAYSTSFRAPAASEQYVAVGSSFIFNTPFASPNGGTTPVFVLSGAGGAGSLKPERARNLTIGAEYSPSAVDGLRFTANYFDINFKDRIAIPSFVTSALLDPTTYEPLITPIADDAAAQAVLQAELARGATFLNLLGTGATGVRNVFSIRQRNISRVRENGFDVGGKYDFSAGGDDFGVNLNATIIRRIDSALTSTAPAADTVNTYGNPLKYRARGGLTWSHEKWTTTTTVNYNGSYKDTLAIPVGSISSSTTLDFNLQYASGGASSYFVSLSVLNLFDSNPSRATSAFVPNVFYDAANGNPLGRFVALEARKRW